MADRAYVERNRAQRERLRALAGGVADEQLGRSLDGGEWTAAVALAHVAYWDGRTLATLEASVRHGIPRAWWDTAEADAVNAARLARWRVIPPREALAQAISTAEALDAYLEALPDDLAAALVDERPLALDRSRHRASHFDEIERALRG
jgi:hypothetical protein